MDCWRRVARRFAFVEYDGPPLEPLDLYTRKSGEEIVGQLYNFEDKGGRAVSLRPEMTPTLARMVGARANALRKPVRWFSMPQLFRYERQQRGRLREHFQLNVDIIGEADVLADAELLAVACSVCAEFGLTSADVRARVSDRRLLNALLDAVGVAPEHRAAVYAVTDKIERDPREVLAGRLLTAGVPDDVAARVFALLDERDMDSLRARHADDAVVAEQFDRLTAYRDHVTALGFGDWLSFDLSIVRGLAYYTGIVFELFDAKGEFRAICGGGRYDTLLASLGGADLPALGFGLGDVVLGELLRERGLMPAVGPSVDVWVAPTEGVEPRLVLETTGRLRARGFSVEYVLNTEKLRTQKTGAQLKAAQKAGALRAVVLRADGTLELRDLAPGGAAPRVGSFDELFGPFAPTPSDSAPHHDE